MIDVVIIYKREQIGSILDRKKATKIFLFSSHLVRDAFGRHDKCLSRKLSLRLNETRKEFKEISLFSGTTVPML